MQVQFKVFYAPVPGDPKSGAWPADRCRLRYLVMVVGRSCRSYILLRLELSLVEPIICIDNTMHLDLL